MRSKALVVSSSFLGWGWVSISEFCDSDAGAVTVGDSVSDILSLLFLFADDDFDLGKISKGEELKMCESLSRGKVGGSRIEKGSDEEEEELGVG